MKKEKNKFNYAVGHYWEGANGSVGCYACGSQIHFGTLKDAKNYLKYVEAQSPEYTWKIFQLVEVPV